MFGGVFCKCLVNDDVFVTCGSSTLFFIKEQFDLIFIVCH